MEGLAYSLVPIFWRCSQWSYFFDGQNRKHACRVI